MVSSMDESGPSQTLLWVKQTAKTDLEEAKMIAMKLEDYDKREEAALAILDIILSQRVHRQFHID